jgi:hypothetical protein
MIKISLQSLLVKQAIDQLRLGENFKLHQVKEMNENKNCDIPHRYLVTISRVLLLKRLIERTSGHLAIRRDRRVDRLQRYA